MCRLGGLRYTTRGKAKMSCQTPLSPHAIDRESKDIGLRRSPAGCHDQVRASFSSVSCGLSGDTLSPPSPTPLDTKGGPVRPFNAVKQTCASCGQNMADRTDLQINHKKRKSQEPLPWRQIPVQCEESWVCNKRP